MVVKTCIRTVLLAADRMPISAAPLVLSRPIKVYCRAAANGKDACKRPDPVPLVVTVNETWKSTYFPTFRYAPPAPVTLVNVPELAEIVGV